MSAPVTQFSDAAAVVYLDAIGALAGWLSVHSADPGTTGAHEIPGTARAPITWAPTTDRVKVGVAQDVAMPAGSQLAHLGLWTAPSGGAFLAGTDRIDPPATGAGPWTALRPSYTLEVPELG